MQHGNPAKCACVQGKVVLQEYESDDWGYTSHGEAFGGGSLAELTWEGVPSPAFAGEAG